VEASGALCAAREIARKYAPNIRRKLDILEPTLWGCAPLHVFIVVQSADPFVFCFLVRGVCRRQALLRLTQNAFTCVLLLQFSAQCKILATSRATALSLQLKSLLCRHISYSTLQLTPLDMANNMNPAYYFTPFPADLPPRPKVKRSIVHRAILFVSSLFSFCSKTSGEPKIEEELEHCGFSAQEIAECKARQERWDELSRA